MVGALLGTAVGVAGGRNGALLVAAPLLTVLAVVFGDLFGTALTEGDAAAQRGGGLTVMDVFAHHFGTLWRAWTHDFGVQRFVILWLSALVAYGLARRFGDR